MFETAQERIWHQWAMPSKVDDQMQLAGSGCVAGVEDKRHRYGQNSGPRQSYEQTTICHNNCQLRTDAQGRHALIKNLACATRDGTDIGLKRCTTAGQHRPPAAGRRLRDHRPLLGAHTI